MDRERSKFYARVEQQLVDHGKHEFELNRWVNGATVRSHLQQAERARPGSKKHELENPAPLPEEVSYLWHWYMELSNTGRIYHDGIAFPLTSSEILAWSQLRGIHLTPWEVRVIRLLDAAEIAVKNRKGEE